MEEGIEKLQGTWAVVAIEQKGATVPAEQIEKAKLTLILTANGFTFKRPNGDSEGTFQIDTTKKTKTIDLKGNFHKDKTVTMLGIYELEGDTLKVCVDEKTRPSEYKSTADGECSSH